MQIAVLKWAHSEGKDLETFSVAAATRDKNRRFREQHLGETMEVLVESARRGGQGRASGLTDNYMRVELRGEAGGRLEPVRITGVTEDGLEGVRLEAT